MADCAHQPPIPPLCLEADTSNRCAGCRARLTAARSSCHSAAMAWPLAMGAEAWGGWGGEGLGG